MKILLTVIAILILAGCAKQMPCVSAGTTEALDAPLADQKMCADQALKYFREHNNNEWSFTNHYDAGTRTCYVEVAKLTLGHDVDIFEASVHDAFGGQEYASILSRGDKPKPPICSVSPRNEPYTICSSENDFDNLVFKYFGTTADGQYDIDGMQDSR